VKSKEDLRIIFLGNPEFSRYHLEQIITSGYTVVAVISAPDRPGGRGMKLLATPVTTYAREQNIPCLQPTNLKNDEFLKTLATYNADLQVVIAFRMLPVVVWDMPTLGTINLHASLLPQYRGAAPINWAIINGEKTTGVSTFKLKHEIDTGDLLVQKECAIESTDNAGTLHDKLMHLGGVAVLETLEKLVTGNLAEIPQNASKTLREAPKLFTENTAITWDQNGENIINLIRGLSPYPVAHTIFDDKKMQVFQARFESTATSQKSGIYKSDGKSYLAVTCADGILYLENIKLQGKRQMQVRDFLNGYDLGHLNIVGE